MNQSNGKSMRGIPSTLAIKEVAMPADTMDKKDNLQNEMMEGDAKKMRGEISSMQNMNKGKKMYGY